MREEERGVAVLPAEAEIEAGDASAMPVVSSEQADGQGKNHGFGRHRAFKRILTLSLSGPS